jgi:L-aminopeptidase/D-esterase-like protein
VNDKVSGKIIRLAADPAIGFLAGNEVTILARMRNLITDVPGVLVGNATDLKIGSGATAIVFDRPAVAAADIRGGGPGVRETALLDPGATVQEVDAIAISGGSAFGLETAAGVMACLAEQGRGFQVGAARIPIVPGAILFDLLSGGDKNWGRNPPYRELGYEAAKNAAAEFGLGSVGAGTGATTENLKGGLGSASAISPTGHIVGAIVAVNAVGRVTIGGGPHLWPAPFEVGREFGGLGFPAKIAESDLTPHVKGGPPKSTTPALVATDAVLTKPQAQRLAMLASAGLARAIWPIFTPLDGDIIFAAATGRRPVGDPHHELSLIGATAAACLARAAGRAIYEATALPYPGVLPAWRDRFGGK